MITNQNVMDAFENCIELRWKPRARGEGPEVGYCALCKLFNAWEKGSSDVVSRRESCLGCPIFEYGKRKRFKRGFEQCDNTPFDTWCAAYTESASEAAAQGEVDFLIRVYEHFFGEYPHGR